MNKWIYEKVRLSRINPLFIENISNALHKRLVNRLKNKEKLHVLQLEKEKDQYYLVGGYAEYIAYKSFKEDLLIDCFVRDASVETKERVTLLSNMFIDKRGSWLDKHEQIVSLRDEGFSIKEIAYRTGVTKQHISYYLFQPKIPSEIITLAKSYNTSLPLINKISRLKISKINKTKLYLSAINMERKSEYLTHDKFEKINWVIKLKGFNCLNEHNQWELIARAFDYRRYLENECQNKIAEMTGFSFINQTLCPNEDAYLN